MDINAFRRLGKNIDLDDLPVPFVNLVINDSGLVKHILYLYNMYLIYELGIFLQINP